MKHISSKTTNFTTLLLTFALCSSIMYIQGMSDRPRYHAALTPKKPVVGDLFFAISKGNLEGVKALITSKKNPIDVNSKNVLGQTALFEATYKENLEMVKLLLELGADINLPNNSGDTPVMMAALKKDATILKFLISKGASTDNAQIIPKAIEVKQKAEIIEFLLSQPNIVKNINVKVQLTPDSDPVAALDVAQRQWSPEKQKIIALLKAKGAKLSSEL